MLKRFFSALITILLLATSVYAQKHDDSKSRDLGEVTIKAKRIKYKRKGNPSVDLIRKVILAKKRSSIYTLPYVSYDKYRRLTLAQNEVSDSTAAQYKRKQHFTDLARKYAYRCEETGKLILPISFEETISREIYRKSDKTRKSIITARHTESVLDVISSVEAMEAIFKDLFIDVDLFETRAKILRQSFVSPVGGEAAIQFYHYAIHDTTMVDGDKCIRIFFSPSNPRNMGFSGTLSVLADSTYRIKQCHIRVPLQSNINFLDGFDIVQTYDTLSTGQQMCVRNRMIAQLRVFDWMKKMHVEHDVTMSNFKTDSIPDEQFNFLGDSRTEPSAEQHDSTFWHSARPDSISYGQSNLSRFKQELYNKRFFRNLVAIARVVIDNSIPTTFDPMKKSKVDFGPLLSTIGKDDIEGWKLRVGATTTAALHPHLFASGYAKYGFKDQRVKGGATLTWCIKKRKNSINDFPMRNISFSYTNDIHSPFGKYLENNRDNMFLGLSWSSNNTETYFQSYKASIDWELENGLSFRGAFNRESNTPVPLRGEQVNDPYKYSMYRSLDKQPIDHLNTTDLSLLIEYRPGAKWIASKVKRHLTNKNAPIYTIAHTVGIKGFLGGEYNYNFTEITYTKRTWLDAWGVLDARLQAGIQWNQVPFSLLIIPASNLSFIRNKNTFNLMQSMEFLNDRYASAMIRWNLNGKLLNLLPINRKLKWREAFGINMMWGYLSDKNNPDKHFNPDPDHTLIEGMNHENVMLMPDFYKNEGDPDKWYSPSGLDPAKPYIEVSAGIHNIFRFFSVDYFQRLTYMHNKNISNTNWGIRFRFEVSF